MWPASTGYDARVVADLVLFDGHEEHVHAVAGPRFQDDVVQVDVVDVEGDVLLGLPADRFAQLLGRHGRKADLLDDDGVARQRGAEVRVADVGRRNEPVDRIDDERGVHDRAVHDRFGGKRLQARFHEPVPPALGVLQLDQLDR